MWKEKYERKKFLLINLLDIIIAIFYLTEILNISGERSACLAFFSIVPYPFIIVWASKNLIVLIFEKF